MHKERTYKVIIKQYSPVKESIILAGPFDTEEEADAIANQLSGRIALKSNQYLAVLESIIYQKDDLDIRMKEVEKGG